MPDLSRAAGVNHTGKMREKLSDLEEAGIIGMDPKGRHHARVWLEADWERRLAERQEMGGELSRARRQARRNRESREAFAHRHDGADKAPGENEMQGPEQTEAAIEKHRETWRAMDAEKAAADHERARAFILDVLGRESLLERGYIRLGLLREMWTEDHAGTAWHFRRAMSSLNLAVKPHAEHPGELFIYGPSEEQTAESRRA